MIYKVTIKRKIMIVGFSVAACSGVFASLASVFSKVALENDGIIIRATVCPWIQEEYCDTVSIVSQVIGVADAST